ncbi:MAG: hypothetical protein JWL64_1485 [Frankiales bacterium]|nr:hypothetical protein [Frankiales bacterium]
MTTQQTDERISVTRRINAPAATIFAVLVDPAGHVRIDGSGMLIAAPDARPVTAVGDTFRMDMDREPLGDHPMGKYSVDVTITDFETDSHIGWTVGMPPHRPVGHVYGYRLEPVDGGTQVTSYCDWSGVTGRLRTMQAWPVVPGTALEASLDKLAEAVEVGA